jgi:glutamine amidotransferase
MTAMNQTRPTVAIVDYALGNLYSVKHACEHEGLEAVITAAREDLLAADAVILPGVGAFGDAMETLRKRDLVSALQEIASSEKPLVGICLGIQLLMTESHEFGLHKGLGIIEGPVVKLDAPREGERTLKVPHVGWNSIRRPAAGSETVSNTWQGTLLEGLDDGEQLYFVHSFIVQPTDPDIVLSRTEYGGIEFCSSFRRNNIFACQFHPERSGSAGMSLYRNLAATLRHAASRRHQ